MTNQPPLIPLEVLFGNPERTSPKISPDGSRIAYIAPSDGVLNVWIRTIGRTDDQVLTADDDRGIRWFAWAHDGRHILTVQDVGGDENWHLYAVDLTAGVSRDLTPFDGVQARVIDVDAVDPEHILVALNRRDPAAHDVYRLELATGELEMIGENPGDIAGWQADRAMRLRAAQRARPDAGADLLVRDDEASPWRTLVSWDHEQAMQASMIGFTADGTGIYLKDARDAEAARLVLVDLATGEQTVIAEDPVYDVAGAMFDPQTHDLQAVLFLRERLEWEPVDPAVGEDLERLATLQRGVVAGVSRDRADRHWLVTIERDDGPVSYWAFDRTTEDATFLFHHRSALADLPLATMEPIAYDASDGLRIHGYATFPPGLPRTDLPTVLVVHGGPWARDVWGFDPQAQWLANRGYLVLQINFRGSTGYGSSFVNAGDREWAGAMHQDLIDGIEWAVGNGFADRERVAIFGGSYGGYAALVGATFTPEVFRCAVSVVGPSNLKTLIESIPPYWATMRAMFHRRMGDPATEGDFMWSRSPLSRVDQIKIPILIAQGANDPRVPQAESEQIVAAMAERGIEHEYLLFEDEGHGFAKPGNRMRFMAAAERFLARHLGGRALVE